MLWWDSKRNEYPFSSKRNPNRMKKFEFELLQTFIIEMLLEGLTFPQKTLVERPKWTRKRLWSPPEHGGGVSPSKEEKVTA